MLFFVFLFFASFNFFLNWRNQLNTFLKKNPILPHTKWFYAIAAPCIHWHYGFKIPFFDGGAIDKQCNESGIFETNWSSLWCHVSSLSNHGVATYWTKFFLFDRTLFLITVMHIKNMYPTTVGNAPLTTRNEICCIRFEFFVFLVCLKAVFWLQMCNTFYVINDPFF